LKSANYSALSAVNSLQVQAAPSPATTTLNGFFRLPEDAVDLGPPVSTRELPGYFSFRGLTCYGNSSVPGAHRPGRQMGVVHSCRDFNLPEIIDNLRLERYHPKNGEALDPILRPVLDLYYRLRGRFSDNARMLFQRLYFRRWQRIAFPAWPVDTSADCLMREALADAMRLRGVDRLPFIWFWPDGAEACVIMTHDVETEKGLRFCPVLMQMDDEHAIKSSFQVVPEERYLLTESVLQEIRDRGFEINVHDLNHDGRLYRDERLFQERVKKINNYGNLFGSRGFRSGILYRNLDWYDYLDFSYDMSVPNSGRLEVQRGGCCTVFPYFIGKILEIPLTTVQDYSLYRILKARSIDLWNEQMNSILEKNGLISFISHPDYLVCCEHRKLYLDLLRRIKHLGETRNLWMPLPRDVDTWWRRRSRLQLRKRGKGWSIEGEGADRARIAWAELHNDSLRFSAPQR
jgi:hypothetical protein